LKVLQHPREDAFIVYDVPDDVAARFACETRLQPPVPGLGRRRYGQYRGTTFAITGEQQNPMALLWRKEDGYWKVVSWSAADAAPLPAVPALDATSAQQARAAPAGLAASAARFAEDWLIRKRYDEAFAVLSPATYACYDLLRGTDEQPAGSPEEAARRIRAGLERVSHLVASPKDLGEVLLAAPPVHASERLEQHPYANAFALSQVPDAFATYADCAFRATAAPVPAGLPPVYGDFHVMGFRLRTQAGETPVLRVLWHLDERTWRIVTYDIETP
jgi:hypothetical protein